MTSLQVAARVMEAVEFLASRESARLDEVAEVLGVHKSNALRLLSTLREREWVVLNDAHTHYSLGPRLISIGRAAVPLGLPGALGLAARLRDLTGESAHVSMRVDDYMLTIGRVESHHELKATMPVGGKDPIHATAVGKAYLATLPDEVIERELDRLDLREFTSRTVTTKPALLRQVRQVREQGYAINDREGTGGITAVAVPLTGDGTGPLSLSLSGPAERFPLPVIESFLPEILRLAGPYSALAATSR